MKNKKIIFIIILILTICISSCATNTSNKNLNTDTKEGVSANRLQGWLFSFENGNVPESCITNCYLISDRKYEEYFHNNDYLDVDPTLRRNSFFGDLKEQNRFVEHSIRYQKNQFITRINPEKHNIKELDRFLVEWEKHVVNDGKLNGFNRCLGKNFKQKENLCWIKALQFLYFYSDGKMLDEKYIFNNSKNSGGLTAALLGLNIFKKVKNDQEVENVPAGLIEILSGFGNESFWHVTNSQGIELIESLRLDSPVLLGQDYMINSDRIQHIVIILGAAYSRNTSYRNLVGEIVGFYNIPGMPYSAFIKDTPFIFHRFLIFDPSDACIKEIDADELINSIAFLALRSRLPKNNYPIKTRDLFSIK